MRILRRAAILAACILYVVPSGQALAQQPTPEQALDMLQTRPDLVNELRERIGESGLTPDQVRARLRAAGYPENLLDSYLAGADTTRMAMPGEDVFAAIAALGITTTAAADSLAAIRDSLAGLQADMVVVDTTELPIFGMDVFRGATTQFDPLQAGPVSDSYRLGPGDELVLILTGDVETAYSLSVNREGFVFIPQVGQLFVANLTLGQLRDVLYTRLGRVYSGVRRGPNATTKFDVTVSRIRAQPVFVVGDVQRPGVWSISASGNALTALYAAGGPTEDGSFRQITIRRGSELVDTLDVYDYLLQGIQGEATLVSGDVVFVPVHGGRVAVTGEVVRPARYEIIPGETLRDVLQMAGGFNAEAVTERVQIYRILPADSISSPGNARVVIDLGAKQFAAENAPGIPMLPGDSVVVFALPEAPSNFVTVSGNVYLEGPVGLTPGMRLSDAIQLAGGPRPDVYLDRILISRMRPDSTRFQLRSAFLDTTGRVTDDILLQDQDQISVFSTSAARPQVFVSVVGAVDQPGRILYQEGMTVRDAILLAGGVTEDADLRRAQIARIPGEREPGVLARTIEVPLDSTYLLARSPDRAYVGAPGIAAPAAGTPEVELEPYDNLVIFRQPGWSTPRLVYLTGRVMHPGRYALTSTTERLGSLIERAGGLTNDAYPGGIEFYRVRQELAVAAALRDTTDSVTAATDTLPPGRLQDPMVLRERVGIDLPEVLDDAGSTENIILAAGDSIHIPEFDPVVMVAGGVNSPGAVAWTEGKSIDWYVESAGGYTREGDRDRVYVVQPDGSKETVERRWLLADATPEPGPGARVFVPEKDLTIKDERSDLPQILGTVAQVFAALVTLIVIANR